MADIQQEESKVYGWLTDHRPQVLINPSSIPVDELNRLVNQAVLASNVAGIDTHRLVKRVMDRLIGPGVLSPYFDDPAVTEIMVVGNRIYIEKHGQIRLDATLVSRQLTSDLAKKICEHCHSEYQSSNPLINLTWPENGARINIVHDSVSPTGAAITIRKRNEERALDIADLIRTGMVNDELSAMLIEASKYKLNLLFSGPPGSGKTSLLRGVANLAIHPRERVIVLEDTEELRLNLEHMMVFLGQTDDPSPEERAKGIITINELFRNALRQRPDRIIVGEIRGMEAFDLLQAALTSEGGVFSTIHLRQPNALLERLLWIAQRFGMNVSIETLQRTIPKAIDFIVQVDRDGSGHRHVSRVTESLDSGEWQDIFVWDEQKKTQVWRNELTKDHKEWFEAHKSKRIVETFEAEDAFSESTSVWGDLVTGNIIH